jgi:hypothetical protein
VKYSSQTTEDHPIPAWPGRLQNARYS